MHDGDCSFSASIDADGYVTIFGIRKFVGLNAKGVYKKTFYGVRRDCELNGTFLHLCKILVRYEIIICEVGRFPTSIMVKML